MTRSKPRRGGHVGLSSHSVTRPLETFHCVKSKLCAEAKRITDQHPLRPTLRRWVIWSRPTRWIFADRCSKTRTCDWEINSTKTLSTFYYYYYFFFCMTPTGLSCPDVAFYAELTSRTLSKAEWKWKRKTLLIKLSILCKPDWAGLGSDHDWQGLPLQRTFRSKV